jgi:hypothetical protein
VISEELAKQKKNTILTKGYRIEFRRPKGKYLEEVREIRDELKKG